MASQRCDGCGSKVRIAGGIGDFWTFASETSGGIDLELADGTDHFLCFDCIERLPEDRDVTAADVAALSTGSGTSTSESESASASASTSESQSNSNSNSNSQSASASDAGAPDDPDSADDPDTAPDER